MSLWKDVPSGVDPPRVIYAVIETPKGSKNKYEIARDFDGVILDRVLHSSVMYPVDYGLLPRSYYEDGDPLDVMVIINEVTFPGCIVSCRPIALLEVIDEGKRDDKILAVAEGDPRLEEIEDIEHLPKHFTKEIENFFAFYKILENKDTKIIGWANKDKAYEAIERSLKLYERKFH